VVEKDNAPRKGGKVSPHRADGLVVGVASSILARPPGSLVKPGACGMTFVPCIRRGLLRPL
jgi:hypothetical protein